MPIIAPAELPVVLKVPSDPMKKYMFSKLGYPQTAIELSEDQIESVLRVTGDFIAGYFPREQRLAVFYTTPLQSTYPMPEDAYWVQQVNWDPVTTRIDDIFGAESFLFCHAGGTLLLTTKGPKPCEEVYNSDYELVTPFGPRKPRLKWNAKTQKIIGLKTDNDVLACTPNHPVNIDHKFRMAICGFPGLKLLSENDKQVEITDRFRTETPGTWSVEVDCGCYYTSCLGEEFYLSH